MARPSNSLREIPLGGGITELRLSSGWTRLFGLPVSCYLLGGVLVDSGPTRIGAPVVRRLRGAGLEAILLTHHHEDHSGNAGEVSRENGCPIYLRNPDARRGRDNFADLGRGCGSDDGDSARRRDASRVLEPGALSGQNRARSGDGAEALDEIVH